MNHVAITGGLGFIGSHLADRFSAAGWRVTIIDDQRGNVVEPSEMTPVAGFIDDDANAWAWRLSSGQLHNDLDLVVHCAAPVGPGLVSSMGGFIGPEIVATTHAVAHACERLAIPLVNVSSSEVYGTGGARQPKEEEPLGHVGPFTARSEYGLAKAVAECMVTNMGGRHCHVRPFNTSGPRQDAGKGFVIPTFVDQARSGGPLTVYEPGAVRAFTHVQDVCSLIVNQHPIMLERGGSWNVGHAANMVTIANLAELVIARHLAETGDTVGWHVADPEIAWGPEYAFFGKENGAKIPDASKAKSIGWKPLYDVDDVIKAVYRS